MRVHLQIHRLAILSLLVVASMSVINSTHQISAAPLAPVFGIAIWSLLLWKIWRRPRKWGLGVGIFLFLMIAFQSYLWHSAVSTPKYATLGVDRSVANFVLLYELPIFIAGVCCTLLRFCYPNDSSGSTAKFAEPFPAPNGGPSASVDSSSTTDGPPSVS